MTLLFIPTHCCRCNEPKPKHRYTYIERRFVLFAEDIVEISVPLCSPCYYHTLKRRRNQKVILIVAIGAGVAGAFGIAEASFRLNIWLGTLAFFNYVALGCGVLLWGVPQLLRPDFLKIAYDPASQWARVIFSNKDYQAKVEYFDNVGTASEKMFTDNQKHKIR